MINFERRRGTQITTAKLTESQVRSIRAWAAKGKTFVWIGKKFGIGDRQVGKIVRRKYWEHVG